MRRAWLALWLVLTGCATVPSHVGRYDVAPAADDWGPHPGAAVEWWYVASTNPREGLAFHVAFFRAPIPPERCALGLPLRRLFPATYALAHVSLTDLRTGERFVRERTDFPLAFARAEGSPLHIALGPWSLAECGDSSRFELRTGPLELSLEAEKPRTVHPPGWSGSADVGRMAYQSITRLRYVGAFRGRPFSGEAWMDHQWGEMIPPRDGRWDWHGLHLDDGTDLMLYDLTRPDGTSRVTQATLTDRAGVTRALAGVSLRPLSTWRAPGGRLYVVGWTVEIGGETLTIRPLHLDQEIVTLPGIAFWEGPVEVTGTFRGRGVRGVGLGEHLPWPEK